MMVVLLSITVLVCSIFIQYTCVFSNVIFYIELKSDIEFEQQTLCNFPNSFFKSTTYYQY